MIDDWWLMIYSDQWWVMGEDNPLYLPKSSIFTWFAFFLATPVALHFTPSASERVSHSFGLQPSSVAWSLQACFWLICSTNIPCWCAVRSWEVKQRRGKFFFCQNVLKFSNELMPKIELLCIVLPGMDFGMSYDVSANMLEAVFTTIQTSAKTESLPRIMTMMIIIIVMLL